MIIHWNSNPFETTVELDNEDRRLFAALVRIRGLEEAVSDALYHLTPSFFDGSARPESARAILEQASTSIDEEERPRQAVPDTDFEAELASGTHCGDCTCIPASCIRCHCEEIAGIDTLPGLGKHEAASLLSAFRPNGADRPAVSAEQALADLEVPLSMEAKAAQPWWEPHLPRWNEERARAAEWLREHLRTRAGTGEKLRIR